MIRVHHFVYVVNDNGKTLAFSDAVREDIDLLEVCRARGAVALYMAQNAYQAGLLAYKITNSNNNHD